ncbi:MAG: hypothetical protein ABFQ53_02960 [Patescibacteria group bacterium]
MEKETLEIIKKKLEKEWAKKSIYFFNSKGELNDDGKRAVELLSRRGMERLKFDNPYFLCIACASRHSRTFCPQCGTPSCESSL